MSRRRRAPAAVGVLALLAAALAPEAQAQRAQTITRAEIDAGGWTRLSELVFAVRGVARTSADGITVGGDVGGLPTWSMVPDNSGWVVLVDGQPMPLSLGGATVLDLVPVSLPQLDSVTIQHMPTAAAGRIAMHGVLHLHTQRGIRGLRASASHYSGNEAGDPGPFAFTPDATLNVDNNGPFHQGRAAYGVSRADVDVAVRRWTDNLTDARVRQRYVERAAPAAPDLWVRHLAPTLRAGVSALGGRHDVHAGVARLTGTFFVPSPRADQSLANRLAVFGVSGAMGTPGSSTVSYRAAAAGLEAAPYGGPLPSTLAHRRREISGGVTVGHGIGRAHGTLGVAASHRALTGGPTRFTAAPNAVELDVLLSLDAQGSWRPALAASAGRGVGGARAAGAMSLTAATGPRTSIRVSAAASSRALGDEGAWMDLALFGLDALRSRRRTSTAVTTAWTRQAAGGATMSLAGTARRESGVHLIVPDTQPDLRGGTLSTRGPLALSNGELRATLDLPAGGALAGGIVYRLTVPLSGPEEARGAADILPRHLLDASVTVIPAFDIRVRPALHLASGTRWPTGTTDHDPSVPAVTRLDLSVEKWVLARRLRLHVLGRNLLNDVERYHPLGADFRLRVFAGATATF